MHGQSDARDRVEQYLLRFRSALRGASKAERSEIVSDIRCHIAERREESALPDEQAIIQTLDALGSPESLAETYRMEGLLNRATAGASPTVLIRATFAWALAGIEGFLALLFLFTGYATALSFLACAGLKPFFPEQVGVWLGPSLFAFGIVFPSPDASRELLGWWIVPVAFALGIGVFVLTTKLGRFFLRRFRHKLGFVRMGALSA